MLDQLMTIFSWAMMWNKINANTLLMGVKVGNTTLKRNLKCNIRKMQNKTVMRYHFVHIRSKTILNSYNIKYRQAGVKVHSVCLMQCKSRGPLWRAFWKSLVKLKIDILCDSEIACFHFISILGGLNYNIK